MKNIGVAVAGAGFIGPVHVEALKRVGVTITGILGVDGTGPFESFLPRMMFAVLFGLSMDYHVFLLSRIRERFQQTGDNAEAVSFGLRSTGRLITGAALIMVAVFGGFALGDLEIGRASCRERV